MNKIQVTPLSPYIITTGSLIAKFRDPSTQETVSILATDEPPIVTILTALLGVKEKREWAEQTLIRLFSDLTMVDGVYTEALQPGSTPLPTMES